MKSKFTSKSQIKIIPFRNSYIERLEYTSNIDNSTVYTLTFPLSYNYIDFDVDISWAWNSNNSIEWAGADVYESGSLPWYHQYSMITPYQKCYAISDNYISVVMYVNVRYHYSDATADYVEYISIKGDVDLKNEKAYLEVAYEGEGLSPFPDPLSNNNKDNLVSNKKSY